MSKARAVMVPKASQAVALQAGVLHDRVICVTGGAGGELLAHA